MAPWARKLQTLASLEPDDLDVLAKVSRDTRKIQPGCDVIGAGDDPSKVYLVLDGFAFRYKLTEGGQRQVFAISFQETFATFTWLC